MINFINLKTLNNYITKSKSLIDYVILRFIIYCKKVKVKVILALIESLNPLCSNHKYQSLIINCNNFLGCPNVG